MASCNSSICCPFRQGLVCFRQRSRQSGCSLPCVRIKIGAKTATALPSATAADHLIGALVGLATGDCGLHSRREPTAGRGSVLDEGARPWAAATEPTVCSLLPLRACSTSDRPGHAAVYSGHFAACSRYKGLSVAPWALPTRRAGGCMYEYAVRPGEWVSGRMFPSPQFGFGGGLTRLLSDSLLQAGCLGEESGAWLRP